MLLRRKGETKFSLRLTSFIDVIFILLLFFIVTSLIMKKAGGLEGDRAYLQVQNSFTKVGQIETYLTVFIYDDDGRVKYRLIHRGNNIPPTNYFQRLATESRKSNPSQNAIIKTTPKLLTQSSLAYEMDKLNATSIKNILAYYKKILAENELSCTIAAQPDIPFYQVIDLYSYMKTPSDEGGLGATNVVLLEFDGNLSSFLNRIDLGV